ncbi:reverse transcriptase domain-containing protein, partial [Tanacetum coccineum]
QDWCLHTFGASCLNGKGKKRKSHQKPSESVFLRSECGDEDRVTFSIGLEQANRITWTELKRLLTNKYCPRTEVKKMEDEFYNLAVKGNDLKTYVRRFQELAVLCPNMVPNTKKLMEVFIGGLPRSIEGNVTASKPQTLEEAITITQRLMEQVIKHNSAQETNDHKRKFDDSRNTNNNNYPNDHNNNNHSNNRNNNNYQDNRNNDNRNHQQQNGRQETFKANGNHGYNGPHPLCRKINQGLGSTSGIRACALRNFDLEVIELENTQNNALAKLPMLKLGEYEMWEIRIKQYLQI